MEIEAHIDFIDKLVQRMDVQLGERVRRVEEALLDEEGVGLGEDQMEAMDLEAGAEQGGGQDNEVGQRGDQQRQERRRRGRWLGEGCGCGRERRGERRLEGRGRGKARRGCGHGEGHWHRVGCGWAGGQQSWQCPM